MKKLFAMLLVAALVLSTGAFAAVYTHDDDIRFEYDENAFEISLEDCADDEDLVILTGKAAAWGDTFVRIHLRDLKDGEAFPTMEDFTDMPVAGEVTQGEWNGFRNVFMYTVEYEDGDTEHYFIAPVTDDDGEVEEILTVIVGTGKAEDEDAATARDDGISMVLDTLKVKD